MSGERNAISDKQVRVTLVSDKNVQIEEATPALVTVTLEPTVSKLVPVKADVVGSPPQGFSYSPERVVANPTTVRVSGAESLIAKAVSASADVNLTGRRAL